MRIDENTNLEDLLRMAKETVREVNQSEEFLVKDLFRGFEWNRIAKGNRTKLGSLFFYYAEHDGKELMLPIGKTAQNQQKYRKL